VLTYGGNVGQVTKQQQQENIAIFVQEKKWGGGGGYYSGTNFPQTAAFFVP